jgi:hypothetical protein
MTVIMNLRLKIRVLRSEDSHPSTSSTGVFPTLCIFCGKSRKKNQVWLSLGSCEYDDPNSNVKNAANQLNDHVMLAKIGSVDFHTQKIKYHHE